MDWYVCGMPNEKDVRASERQSGESREAIEKRALDLFAVNRPDTAARAHKEAHRGETTLCFAAEDVEEAFVDGYRAGHPPSQPAPSADAAMAELESALQFVICFDGFGVLNESCPGEPMYCAKIDDHMSQTKPSVGEAVVALAIEIGWERPLPAPPGGGK